VLATFVLVLFTWVLFRAETFPAAIGYLGSMFGLGQSSPSAALAPALIYQPQSILILAMCVLVHVLRLDTWDLAREVRPGKLVFAGAGLAASVAVLFTQSYNPFLYFRF
jgi:alginate O-acetyltransferase complex protein AlgI